MISTVSKLHICPLNIKGCIYHYNVVHTPFYFQGAIYCWFRVPSWSHMIGKKGSAVHSHSDSIDDISCVLCVISNKSFILMAFRFILCIHVLAHLPHWCPTWHIFNKNHLEEYPSKSGADPWSERRVALGDIGAATKIYFHLFRGLYKEFYMWIFNPLEALSLWYYKIIYYWNLSCFHCLNIIREECFWCPWKFLEKSWNFVIPWYVALFVFKFRLVKLWLKILVTWNWEKSELHRVLPERWVTNHSQQTWHIDSELF